MVAFHYPPLASSIGALRSHAFAYYLPHYGWHAHVLAPAIRAYSDIDREAGPTAAASLHRSWALDAKRHLGWKGRYPASVAVPDRWASWAPAAITAGLGVIRRYPIEAIWSTYPIATSHVIGAVLARLSGLPWIVEYRDPVSAATAPWIQRWSQHSIERHSARQARQLVFVTQGAMDDFGQRYPESAGRLNLIPNGYDESLDLEISSGREPRAPDAPLKLVHSGHLYPEGRNPTELFKALAQLKHDGSVDASRLQVTFRNAHEDGNYQAEIDRLQLDDMVTLAPRIGHREALIEQRQADGLLLLQGAKFNRQIPAKVFEYLRSNRPILALVDNDGNTAKLLGELGGGLKVALDDSEAIAKGLMQFLAALKDDATDDDQSMPWPVDTEALTSYSRASQTRVLAELLDRVSECGKLT